MGMKVFKEDFSLETRDRVAYQLILITGNFTVKHLMDVKMVVSEMLEGSVINIIFSLEGVTHMDSSAMGLMGNLHKILGKKGGVAGVLKPSEEALRLLKSMGLLKVLKFFASLESADEHFEL